jgi:hypothetical protein
MNAQYYSPLQSIKGQDFDSFEALLSTNGLQNKQVLLTVGY